MDFLLDTHALIWFSEDNKQLSLKARSIINNNSNKIFLSIVSFFELAIKFNEGKLDSELSLIDFFALASNNSIVVLPISQKDLSNYLVLPVFADHRDPFDKLIIATAMEDHLTIITTDKKFILYKELVDIIW